MLDKESFADRMIKLRDICHRYGKYSNVDVVEKEKGLLKIICIDHVSGDDLGSLEVNSETESVIKIYNGADCEGCFTKYLAKYGVEEGKVLSVVKEKIRL